MPVPPVVATGDVCEREVGKAEYASFHVLEAREVSENAATGRAISGEAVDPVGKNLSPPVSAASQIGAGCVPNLLSRRKRHRFEPATAPTVVTLPSAAAPTPLAHAPRDIELPPPSPEMNSCPPSDRAGWLGVETHTLFA